MTIQFSFELVVESFHLLQYFRFQSFQLSDTNALLHQLVKDGDSSFVFEKIGTNIANEYATKRYRSNLINWGMLPFTIDKGELPFKNKDYIFVPDVRKAVEDKLTKIPAYVVNEGMKEITLTLGELTDDEREIILKG